MPTAVSFRAAKSARNPLSSATSARPAKGIPRCARNDTTRGILSRVKPLVLAAALMSISAHLAASYASRDLVVPVAGRAAGADGRAYLTALWITNTSDDPLDAKLTFHPASAKPAPAFPSSLHLAPHETHLFDPVDRALLGNDFVTGWMRIESPRELLATARVYSRMASDTNARSIAASFSAVPAQFAIGSGEATTLQGVTPADARYKIYFAEITGQPLEVWVALVDPRGITVAETHVYVDRFQHLTKDAAELFPSFTAGTALLRIEGMHGLGRVIVAGSAIAKESLDATAFEMSFPTASRDRVGAGEAAAYIAAAAAVIVAIVIRRR